MVDLHSFACLSPDWWFEYYRTSRSSICTDIIFNIIITKTVTLFFHFIFNQDMELIFEDFQSGNNLLPLSHNCYLLNVEQGHKYGALNQDQIHYTVEMTI